MEFNIFDIYTDASINLDEKLGCAGMVLVDRRRDQILDAQYFVINNATNNMSEIIAIWMGIHKAVSLLYTESLAFQVNLFSDSQISLFGMREWMPNWIRKRKGDILINSVGPVANQDWFVDAYHTILSSGLKIKFFHQKGHVDETNPNSLFVCEKQFRTSNPNSLHMIGSTAQIISKYNNYVDATTRDIVIGILNGIDISNFHNARYLCNIPFAYDIDNQQLIQYQSQIKGGLNYPINFNGG